MNGEPRGRGEQRLVQVAQLVQRHARPGHACDAGRHRLRQRRHEVFLRLQRRVGGLQHQEVLLLQAHDGAFRHHAVLHQHSRVQLPNRRVRRDLAIHLGLREGRLVALVVAVAPVAHEVDQEVAPEARPILPRQPRGLQARHRIVRVHVDDGDLEAARQAARVAGAVGLARGGGEAQLVVGDDVQRAVGVVAGQPRQVQRFGHDPLARERHVAVNEDRQCPGAVEMRRAARVGRGAGGPRHAHHHRVHGLEVAGVRHQRHEHLAARHGR